MAGEARVNHNKGPYGALIFVLTGRRYIDMAVLFYGYDLGGPKGEGWRIKKAGFLDEPKTPWMSPDGDHALLIELTLLEEAGEVVPAEPESRSKLVAQRYGVTVVPYGSPASPGYGLAVAGSVFRTDTRAWVSPALHSNGPVRLSAALLSLAVEPLQANPSWILASCGSEKRPV